MKRVSFILISIILLFLLNIQVVYSQENIKKERPKVGLVLSGGGAKGFAHIGIIKAIEDIGLEVDYVGGTSIGSIIGAMYAAGYTSDQMIAMIREQNWTDVIQDVFPRRDLSIQEKGLDEKFFATFPISKKQGIHLPLSVVQGQQVMNILEKMFLPTYNIKNFEDLQTPFLCVATDLLSGDALVLDTGNLALAVRSSMSIPSFFAPVKYGNHLLVDGGVVNNYPVMDVKKMGADIIIGVDVQSPTRTLGQLNNPISIMTQIVEFHGKPAVKMGKEHTNIFIQPDISGYNMMSFTDYDSIINRGMLAGKKAMPQLKALRDSLNKIAPAKINRKSIRTVDSVYITSVKYEGLEWLNENFMEGQIHVETPSWLNIHQFEEMLTNSYGTKFFESIRYDIRPISKEKNELIISVIEASARTIGFSIHYDSYYEASINTMGTFRNFLVDGSKLSVALSLGRNPLLYANYFINRGYRLGPGISLTAEALDIYQYIKAQASQVNRFSTVNFSLYAISTNNNSVELGVGADLEFTSVTSKISVVPIKGVTSLFGVGKFFLNFDTFNSLYYPTKGSEIKLLGEYIYQFSPKIVTNTGSFFVRSDMSNAIPLSKRLAIISTLNIGLSLGEKLPIQNRFYLGGLPNYSLKGLTTFMGMDFLERSGNQLAVAKVELQYNIISKKHFVKGHFNIGTIDDDFDDLFVPEYLLFGYGLTYSYNSLIGPLSFTLMSSNRDPILGMLYLGFKI